MSDVNRLRVDVVIPTFCPDKKLKQQMNMLGKQTYPIHKIVIMNTGGGNREEINHYKGTAAVELYHLPEESFDHGGTRNEGAGYCTGDIVVFMTQDAVPVNEFLIEKLIEPFTGMQAEEIAGDEIAVTYARQLPDKDCRPVEKFTRSFNYPSKSCIKSSKDIPVLGIKTFFASNVCAAYRMDIFRHRGGFITSTIFNEDMIYAGNAVKDGLSIAYAAEAKVIHSHNYNRKQQFQRNFDLAVSQAQHPEIFSEIKSESEGIQLVKLTVQYLMKIKKPYLIPGLIFTSGCKYAGYFLGKRYKLIPKRLIKAFSMNKNYWEKVKE